MNKRLLVALLGLSTLLALATTGQARRLRPASGGPTPGLSLDRGNIEKPLRATALADTTFLGSWTFDNGGCTAEGWVSVDRTEQVADYVHVDDFAGLGGGNAGLLVPLEGSQSMWCGVRPDGGNPDLCAYATLPGYGDRWDQALCSRCMTVSGNVAVDYLISYDVEDNYDYVYVQWDACDDAWQSMETLTGTTAATFKSDVIDSLSHGGSARVRFRFVSDPSWSDYDGLWDTDGAFIVDSVTVSDGGGVVLATEDFEGEALGDHATTSGDWQSCVTPGYGDFAGLFPGTGVVQENSDCDANLTCLWGFFAGSTATYACGGFPLQPAVPFVNDRGQYISNEIWSPWIPLAGTGSGFEFAVDLYGDLPLNNVVFWVWHVRSKVVGCAQAWMDNQLIFPSDPGWQRQVVPVGLFVSPAATDIQLALGVVDLCESLCGVYGNSHCHSHAPLFDNVEVRRLQAVAPEWSVSYQDLFQDNFPGDGTTTGTVRADMAQDINPAFSPVRPGDSCVVTVSYPGDGIGTDPYTASGPAIYTYVSVWPQGQPGKTGAALSGDESRWPAVGSFDHNGDTWTTLRMDTVFSAAGTPVSDRFCVDLNDNLFEPGDTVCFAFSATSGVPLPGATSYWTEFTGETTDLAFALDNPMEFTCLPTPAAGPGFRVLYVDAADARGAQPAFDAAFEALGISSRVDRYDQRAPWRPTRNNLSTRVTSAVQQLAHIYDVIVWSNGRGYGMLGDGVKVDDAALLADFMNERCNGGIFFNGDDMAWDIASAGGAGGPALRAYIGFSLDGTSHTALGQDVSPLVAAAPGSCFDHAPDDTLVAYGGCPTLRDFDVISPTGTATLEASYLSGALTGGAVVAQQQYNPGCAWVGPPQRHGVVLAGFGFEAIENDVPSNPTDAVAFMDDVLSWLVDTPTGVATGTAPRNALAQNYPNPFNPVTAIDFQIRQRGPVTLRVYNVAGQVVRTLVDRPAVAPGVVHTVEWDGRNDRGQNVASGVYFYKLVTTGYARTRKMVLLK